MQTVRTGKTVTTNEAWAAASWEIDWLEVTKVNIDDDELMSLIAAVCFHSISTLLWLLTLQKCSVAVRKISFSALKF